MITALIVSGGKGMRMGDSLPKQFLPLLGIPIIVTTLGIFDQIAEIDEIILVLPKDYFSYYENMSVKTEKKVILVEAGIDRQESVYKGLLALTSKEAHDLVLIHDGVRPLVTPEIILEGIAQSKKYGAAACGVRLKDTLKRRDEHGFSGETLSREEYFLIQTPQCFRSDRIIQAHAEIQHRGLKFTDDTGVYEEVYGPVYLYEGNYENIKITTREDLDVGKSILSRRKSNKVSVTK